MRREIFTNLLLYLVIADGKSSTVLKRWDLIKNFFVKEKYVFKLVIFLPIYYILYVLIIHMHVL